MFGEDFVRDFFNMPTKPKTSFSEWATNPRTVAMMERDSNQLLEIKRLRAELASFKSKPEGSPK
jgi:hypothetical protein